MTLRTPASLQTKALKLKAGFYQKHSRFLPLQTQTYLDPTMIHFHHSVVIIQLSFYTAGTPEECLKYFYAVVLSCNNLHSKWKVKYIKTMKVNFSSARTQIILHTITLETCKLHEKVSCIEISETINTLFIIISHDAECGRTINQYDEETILVVVSSHLYFKFNVIVRRLHCVVLNLKLQTKILSTSCNF